MSSTGWNVWLGGHIVDTVFFESDMDSLEVTKSLVEHDGYDPSIKVTTTEYVPLIIDAWEADEIAALLWGRIISAEAHAKGRDGEPPEYMASEAQDARRLRPLYERVRFVSRELQRG